MAGTVIGRRGWAGGRDEAGHRTYKVEFKIRCDRKDGPATIMQTPGLPQYGDAWVFSDSTSSDIDIWAFCKMPITLEPDPGEDSGEPATLWIAGFIFSTMSESKRCHENQIDDPLLVPDRISGGSIKYSEEATVDRHGRPILTSSHEMLRGAQVEFDANRDSIRIEQNRADLELPLLVALRDTVNRDPLWGLPPRCVKLSAYTWEKKYYGLCEVYYTRTLEFETNPNGFDRDLLDEGTKVLSGHWNDEVGTGTAAQDDWILDDINGESPNPDNPTHFIRYKDRYGENAKVILNGRGLPAGATIAEDGPYFAAIHSSGAVNKNKALSNTVWWQRIIGTTSPEPWSSLATYSTGQLVTHSGGTYMARYKNGGLLYSFPPATFPEVWRYLPSYGSAGAWDPTTTYSPGQYVTAQIVPTEVGYIHVEKYPDSDFLLLGVPTVL